MSSSHAVTGYDTDDRFYATRYRQGGRQVYAVDLSLAQIAALLPAPDPDNPTEGNRRIRPSHASAFGDYVREHPEWVSPALVLRGPDIFQFEVTESIAGTEFGVLSFPRLARTDLRILDGQHRILGIHMAIQDIANDLEKQRSLLAGAKKGNQEPAVIEHHRKKVAELEEQRERLSRERISLQIFVEDDSVAYKQMFFDIADNALGITSSVRARFDNRKIVNRCVEDVVRHALLAGRVDLEQDRLGRNNPNLVGAKHVAEIIRTIAVGIDGRIGKRLEEELREDALVEATNAFLDVMVDAFPMLERVSEGELEPEELRKSSLLGSTTMLRVLAGVYHDLTTDDGWPPDDVGEFFSALEPHMGAPVTEESPWATQIPEDIFTPGAMAPTARRQDLKRLTETLRAWAINRPVWLSSPAEVPTTG
jgi:DNA-sulfur modification-associated